MTKFSEPVDENVPEWLLSDAPSFPVYPGDELASSVIAGLSNEEYGALCRLRLFIWKDRFCAVENDPGVLATLSNLGKRLWKTAGKNVMKCLIRHPFLKNSLTDADLLAKREALHNFRVKKSNSGKKGAEKRWGKVRKELEEKAGQKSMFNGAVMAPPYFRHEKSEKNNSEPMAPPGSRQEKTMAKNSFSFSFSSSKEYKKKKKGPKRRPPSSSSPRIKKKALGEILQCLFKKYGAVVFQFIAVIRKKHLEIRGVPYVFQDSDGDRLEDILSVTDDLTILRTAFVEFLQSDDPWLEGKPRNLAIFLSQIQVYLEKAGEIAREYGGVDG